MTVFNQNPTQPELLNILNVAECVHYMCIDDHRSIVDEACSIAVDWTRRNCVTNVKMVSSALRLIVNDCKIQALRDFREAIKYV